MKYIEYFLVLLLIPFIVLAEECDISKITIPSIEQKSIEGNTVEVDKPKFQDKDINLNLKMFEIGDSISYDVTIKNDSEEDYMIDEDSFKTDSEYIEYSLKTNDNSNVIKAKSTKDLTLTVTYKKEIDDSLLTNYKYDAANNLKISLNTKDKPKELAIITTDNIKESKDPVNIKNPVTSINSIKLIIIILLSCLALIYLLINNKRKYSKYLIILLSLLTISTVYAICKVDIDIKSSIEIEKKPKLVDTILDLSNQENACIVKYEGDVTDEVGKTVPASKVYFDKCVDKRHVIFAGYCWQVIRTTETGGTKMIYNGEPVEGKCESTRDEHTGIVGKPINYLNDIEANEVDLSEEYLYGTTFTYDKENATFTLIDTNLETWSDSTYENLISKYTCMNTTGTCTKLYNVNAYASNTTAITAEYTIGNTNYAQIGTSPFNGSDGSLSTAGYMFNKAYKYNVKIIYGTTYYKFGNSVTYNDGKYTLTGNTYSLKNIAGDILKDYHYTCWNSTGECTNVAYIYFNYSSEAYYILLSDGKTGSDAVTDMLFSDDVNKYDSSVKGIIDAWYTKELSSYTNYLEDTVYCNSRNIDDIGGWNPNGGKTLQTVLKFKNYSSISNMNSLRILSCHNITDQFAVSNNKAKLKYPVALLQEEEQYNLAPKTTLDSPNLVLVKTNTGWWVLSPRSFNEMGLYNNSVNEKGIRNNYSSFYPNGVRPVISLKSNIKISSGTGSETDPWIIE